VKTLETLTFIQIPDRENCYMSESRQESVILMMDKDISKIVNDLKERVSSKEGRKAIIEAFDEANKVISQIEKAQRFDPTSFDRPYNL
jgi:hypothetical protein